MVEAPFGLDDQTELLYRAALVRRNADPGMLADWIRWPLAQVRAGVQTLLEQGLCINDGVRLTAVPPEEVEVRRREAAEAKVDDLRRVLTDDATVLGASEIGEFARGRRRPSTGSGVEVLTDLQEIADTMRQLHRQVRREVVFTAPYGPVVNVLGDQEIVNPAILGRGITMRGVWVARLFAGRTPAPEIVTLARKGGVRTIDVVPMRAIVWDRAAAVLPVDGFAGNSGAMVIREPALATMVGEFINRNWDRAFAWDDQPTPVLTNRHRTILEFLAEGRTDQAIANQLRLGERTVRRSIAQMCEALGVSGRVALGVEAMRRGLIV